MLNLIVRFLGIGGEDVLTWVCQGYLCFTFNFFNILPLFQTLYVSNT